MTSSAARTDHNRDATGRGGGPYLWYGPPHLPGDRGASATGWPRGVSFIQDGQRYTLDRMETHTRRDGETVPLVVLVTNCPDCGEAFEVRQPVAGTASLTRRCSAHRSPGKRVQRHAG